MAAPNTVRSATATEHARERRPEEQRQADQDDVSVREQADGQRQGDRREEDAETDEPHGPATQRPGRRAGVPSDVCTEEPKMRKIVRRIATSTALALGATSAGAQPVVRQPNPAELLYVLAHVNVTQDRMAEARSAIHDYLVVTRPEPGLLRAEVLQELRPNHFDLVEVWRDPAAYQAHAARAAAVGLHDLIAPWRGSPLEERLGSEVQ